MSVEFQSEWQPISFSDRDWYLALGDSSYSVTGTVIVPADPTDPVVVHYQVHMYDYYTWDDEKATEIGPVTIQDETLQGLPTAGLAQEYDIYGSTETITIELDSVSPPAPNDAPELQEQTTPPVTAPADDDRDGDRSDPTRPTPRDDDRVPELQA